MTYCSLRRVWSAPKFAICALLSILLSPIVLHAEHLSHTWKGGAGNWDELSRWGGAPFLATDTATIEGDGQVLFTHGDVTLSYLDVGAFHNANGIDMEAALAYVQKHRSLEGYNKGDRISNDELLTLSKSFTPASSAC